MMNDFNTTEDYPIPEGLEFQESYMQDAFAMYDAEKQKRKRRLLIWWIFSATGFATVLLTGMYFLTKGPGSDSDKTPAVAGTSVSAGTETHAQNHSTVQAKEHTSKSLAAETNDVNRALAGNEKTVESVPVQTGAASGYSGAGKTKSRFAKLAGRKTNNGSGTIIPAPAANPGLTNTEPNPPATPERIEKTNQAPEPAENTPADSSMQSDLTALSPKPAFSALTKDTAIHSQTDVQPAVTPEMRKSQVYFNLGVNTLFGMKELQNRVTFRECIGVSYNYQINPKWGIGAGLEYHSISRITYKRKVGDTTNSDKTTTILNKTTLNYVNFLPQVSYQLGAKHQLTAGFGIEYLLTDPGERYEIDNFTSESSKRTNSKLYYSTFNRFNFSASVGYAYQFGRFMSVHALYHFGFTDITKDNTFTNTFDRNSRLQLMLKIKLY